MDQYPPGLRGMMAGGVPQTVQGLLSQVMMMASSMTKVKTEKQRNWTCRKCGDTFHPHLSKALCDVCIKRRDGDL